MAAAASNHSFTQKGIQSKTTLLIGLLCCLFTMGCRESDDRQVITLWHQMVPAERAVLQKRIQAFEKDNPDIRIRTLYKETEELRSGFQAATLAGIGPELVYGPSDVLGTFHPMGIVQDMTPWLPENIEDDFQEGTVTILPALKDPEKNELVQLPDRLGNHLALVYNRDFIKNPPKTTDELIKLAVDNSVDENDDGRYERYGIVWNFIEPFFAIPFLTGHGAWIFDESGDHIPALDTPESAEAYRFLLSMRDDYKIMPRNCNYETADALFKSGKAAMIINGDWSWADYLATEGIDAVVAPLPIVSSTGLPMGPMISPKGYSLNAYAEASQADAAMKFVKFATSKDSQRYYMKNLRTMPALKSLYEDPMLAENETLRASNTQLENGRMMPVANEMRAIWDSMRPHYQSLLGGTMDAEAASQAMQRDAVTSIEFMNRKSTGESAAWMWQLAGILVCGTLVFWQRKSLLAFLPDVRKQPLAYLLVTPALVTIFITVVFPFFYNVALSLSDMSLANFQDWKIVGLSNYKDVFTEQLVEIPSLSLTMPMFFLVLIKTIIWTAVNVFFHVAIGVMLAVALNGPIRGKALYRTMLIIPWAVPAYITALTWRSMFNVDYGAINLLASRWLGMDPINWLGEPGWMFTACIITNIWLGYPFMMVIALGGLQGIPNEMYEAAKIDGATRWQQFQNVTMPLLKPVLAPAVTLGAIWTFNNLNIIWLVSNGGEPSDKTHILVSYVYKAVFNFYRYGYGAALSMVIFAILLVGCLLGLQRSQATENVYG